MTRFGRDVLAASAVAIATYLTAHALVPRAEPPTDRDESSTRYFRDCSEARASGDAPIYPREPGYRAALDEDGDGIACELYSGG
ncbi:excalibur calcium-binding domain-containing protein [Sphingosinicella sp. CPCC 101087]|uniref:excalibur calcium-binding domain-containing protein n=1 Tax=Sphingosinicella sp. CPCC 101087 TaxID=2497754 RepID=UPI00101C3BB5|nr:excalibur calcium-binding domain-containing protein [Sphingosinicella sp. CPCC 101087]